MRIDGGADEPRRLRVRAARAEPPALPRARPCAAGARAASVSAPSDRSAAGCLRIDTATTTIVVAAGSTDGDLLAAEAFEGRYRHSQELLPAVVRVIERAGVRHRRSRRRRGRDRARRVHRPARGDRDREDARPRAGLPDRRRRRRRRRCWPRVDGRGGALAALRPRDRVAVVAGEEPVVVRRRRSRARACPPARIEVAVDLDGRAPRRRSRAVARRSPGCRRPSSGSARRDSRRASATIRSGSYRATRARREGRRPSDPEGGVAWSRDPR